MQHATDSSSPAREGRTRSPDRVPIPRTALYLSLGGLLPMVIATVAIWAPFVELTIAKTVLLSYCAVILAFIGAVHWGMSLRLNGRAQSHSLIVSVLAPLYAWLALLVGSSTGLLMMMAGFAGVYCLDLKAARDDKFPKWYLRLRKIMTGCVLGWLSIAYGTLLGT